MTAEMRQLHEEVWCALEKLRQEIPGLYYKPRQRGRTRLEGGYWFIGNDKYLMVGLAEGSDSNEKVHNIGFVVTDDGCGHLKLSARDAYENKVEGSAEICALLERLASRLSTQGEPMIPHHSGGRWDKKYRGTWEEALKQCILVDWPIIQEELKACATKRIRPIAEEDFDRYKAKIDGYRSTLYTHPTKDDGDYAEADKQASDTPRQAPTPSVRAHSRGVMSKSTAPTRRTTQASDTEVSSQHNEMQNALMQVLRDSGNYKPDTIRLEENYIDIVAQARSGEWHYFELKTYDARHSIREGLGQILEYNHYIEKRRPAERLYIVSPNAPTSEDKEYLDRLRKLYNLPLWYRVFDRDKGLLSQEY